MNKEFIINNSKKKFDGELLNIVLKQIDDYFELVESNYKIENKYCVGDDVVLNQNHLLHGIGIHTDKINIFAEYHYITKNVSFSDKIFEKNSYDTTEHHENIIAISGAGTLTLNNIQFLQNGGGPLGGIIANHGVLYIYNTTFDSNYTGKDKRFRNNAFEKVSLFTDAKTNEDDIKVLGLIKNNKNSRKIDNYHMCLPIFLISLR